MHILFVHQNFPAQFGHIAKYLIQDHGFRCTFASERLAGTFAGIETIQYRPQGSATAHTHYCGRTFENQIWRSHALYEVLAARPDIRPDLIVGHSGFVSTLFLRELYDCPIINYFEYFYRTTDSDMDFRADLPGCPLLDALRARARNAMLLLDLDNCDAAYAPTHWQRDQIPRRYHDKVNVVFDGVDTSIWYPRGGESRQFAGWTFPRDKRLVTYVSRGMESLRGFDIFMRMAKRLCEMRDDVLFAVVGEDRVAYGNDHRFTDGKTFKQWVLDQDDYDLNRILFLGRIPPDELAQLLAISDLHVYLTVPFVVSWSLFDALACGCTVLASDTAPVQEVIQHGVNGLLVDFFDVESFVAAANQVLDDPVAHRHLGQMGLQLVREQYSMEKCLPKMLSLYERVTG